MKASKDLRIIIEEFNQDLFNSRIMYKGMEYEMDLEGFNTLYIIINFNGSVDIKICNKYETTYIEVPKIALKNITKEYKRLQKYYSQFQ